MLPLLWTVAVLALHQQSEHEPTRSLRQVSDTSRRECLSGDAAVCADLDAHYKRQQAVLRLRTRQQQQWLEQDRAAAAGGAPAQKVTSPPLPSLDNVAFASTDTATLQAPIDEDPTLKLARGENPRRPELVLGPRYRFPDMGAAMVIGVEGAHLATATHDAGAFYLERESLSCDSRCHDDLSQCPFSVVPACLGVCQTPSKPSDGGVKVRRAQLISQLESRVWLVS
jgi:hypothetical protein